MDWATPADHIQRLFGQTENDAIAFRVLHGESALVEQRRRRGEEADALLLDLPAQRFQGVRVTAGEGGEAELVGLAFLEQHLPGGAAANKALAEALGLH